MTLASSDPSVPVQIIVPVAIVGLVALGLATWYAHTRCGKAASRTITVLALMTAAVAGVVRAFGGSNGWTIAVACVAGALAAMDQFVSKVLIPRFSEVEQREERERVEQRNLSRLGTIDCPPIDEIDPAALGVHPAGLTDDLDGRGLPTYVPRDVDASIVERLHRRERLVVVAGHPKTGKTRTLFEAVASLDPMPRIYIVHAPQHDEHRAIEELVGIAGRLGAVDDLIVWIDDAHEHFDRGLTTDSLDALLEALPNATIAMTVHLSRLKQIDRSVGGQLLDRLRIASATTTLPRALHDSEQEAAAQIHEALAGRERLPFLAELLASVPELRERRKMADEPAGQAIVDAAIAWRRIGMSPAISEADLLAMANLTIRNYGPTYLGTDEFRAGLAWASAPIATATALISRVDEESWRAFDAIVADAEGDIADGLWQYAFDRADSSDLMAVGQIAYSLRRFDRSQLAWSRLADTGDPRARYNLGVLHHEAGNRPEAAASFAAAADAGHPRAYHELGRILLDDGERDEAIDAFRQGAEQGDVWSMSAYASELFRDGEVATSIEWWTHAADLGDVSAMYNLGNAYFELGDIGTAREWWLRAADDGRADAIYNVGASLVAEGDIDDAIDWFTRAAELGSVPAMYNLGNHAFERDDLAAAEHWFERAARHDHRHSLANLGNVRARLGDLDAAIDWWRRAAESGQTLAMYNLGCVYHHERGDDVAAIGWWTKAAELDHPASIHNLGQLAHADGDTQEAVSSWTRAAELGYPPSMSNLGAELEQQGDDAQATTWSRRAAELGDVNAMSNLARHHRNRGDAERAREWATRAIERGHLPAWTTLGLVAADEGDVETARHHLERAAAGGSATAMFNLGVLAEQADDASAARGWFERAADAGDSTAMVNLGTAAAEEGSIAEARVWFERAAAEGDEDGKRRLTELADDGDGNSA